MPSASLSIQLYLFSMADILLFAKVVCPRILLPGASCLGQVVVSVVCSRPWLVLYQMHMFPNIMASSHHRVSFRHLPLWLILLCQLVLYILHPMSTLTLSLLVIWVICKARREFNQVIKYSKECLQFHFGIWLGIYVNAFIFLRLGLTPYW